LSKERVLSRAEIPLLPAGEMAPYHVAADLASEAAHEWVTRSIAVAQRMAAEGIASTIDKLAQAGHRVQACGVLGGAGMPAWTTEQIIAVHVRMHQAEGELFREALAAGATACGLALTSLREKFAFDDAAKLLGVPRAEVEARLAALGKSAGPPWGKNQREAAAAACAALARATAGRT
jgi:hypothetical protein